MGLLSISTPSWLYSLITGSCSEYKMQCISQTQQSFFYLALVLIMIGRSGCDATMETLNYKGNADEKELMLQYVASGSGYTSLQATFLVLTPWSTIFWCSSVYSSMALFLLMEKSWSYKVYINNAERSPITRVFRVFVAYIRRIPHKIRRGDLPLHQIRSRFSIQDVEDAKTLVRMLPTCAMYAFFMLISTICSTYFLQTGKRLKPSTFFGYEFINVSYLAWFYLNEEVRNKFKYKNMYGKKDMIRTKVIDAGINAIICCTIAALTEKSRLGVIRKHGLANKPGEIIPMSTFWLLPQFVMLGYFNNSLAPILQIFFYEETSVAMKNFKAFVFDGFIGAGNMSSVLVTYLVGKISETGGRPNWFQHDTENSRLDMFYWVLTVLCIIFFVIWSHVSHYLDKVWYPNSYHKSVNV